jgi:hypothetical protein
MTDAYHISPKGELALRALMQRDMNVLFARGWNETAQYSDDIIDEKSEQSEQSERAQSSSARRV